MKQLLTVYVLLVFIGCVPQQQNYKTGITQKPNDSINQTTFTDSTEIKPKNSADYEISTYDNLGLASQLISHKETLRQLSGKAVFRVIHNKLVSTLNTRHKEYFLSNPNYQVLSAAKGNLFRSNSDDYAFVTYDIMEIRVSILVYNDNKKEYLDLYRDLKIENGLKSAECNYFAFGSLDYQLGNEIVYQEESLIKKPERYLENPSIKICDVLLDNGFVINSGCLSTKVSKNDLSNSLCISTSAVYNNWECLKLNKSKTGFLIFYGQAFAD